MANELVAALRRALSIRVEDLSPEDSMYADEAFFDESIRRDFAGWYREEELPTRIAFIMQMCAIAPPARVLDAACGHGRYSVLLSQKGYRVTGTDISARLIAHLSRVYGGAGISFEKRSFQELDYAGAFDLAVVLGNSLSLIASEEMPEALGNLCRALTSEGTLFLELDNRHYVIANEAGKCCWDAHGGRWLRLSRYYYDRDSHTEKALDICVDLQEMSVACYPVIKHLYGQEELSQFLRGAEFMPVQWFGDWEGHAVSDATPSLIVVARKAC